MDDYWTETERTKDAHTTDLVVRDEENLPKRVKMSYRSQVL